MLEKMDVYYTKKVDGYEARMMGMAGSRKGYSETVKYVPENCVNLLDIGCGTGLELKAIFERFPELHVTGIDCTQAMLNKLKEHYPDKNINLICEDYFRVDFGIEKYDCVISSMTVHHFPPSKKALLYKKIYGAVKNGGCYVECDYIAESLAEEQEIFKEIQNLRKIEGMSPDPASDDEVIHNDVPCCAETQLRLFREAGFYAPEKIRLEDHVAIFRCKKQ